VPPELTHTHGDVRHLVSAVIIAGECVSVVSVWRTVCRMVFQSGFSCAAQQYTAEATAGWRRHRPIVTFVDRARLIAVAWLLSIVNTPVVALVAEREFLRRTRAPSR